MGLAVLWGFCGGIAVLLSAWGAHGLEDLFIASPRDRFSFNYATNFQLFHALLLISLVFFMISSGTPFDFASGIFYIFSPRNSSFFIPNLWSNYLGIFRTFLVNSDRWNLFFSRLELDFLSFHFQNHKSRKNRSKSEL